MPTEKEIIDNPDSGMLRRQDLEIIRKALQDKYEIPKSVLVSLPAKLDAMLQNTELPPRTHLAAGRCMVALQQYELDKLKLLEKLTASQDININVEPTRPLRLTYRVKVDQNTPPNIENKGNTTEIDQEAT